MLSGLRGVDKQIESEIQKRNNHICPYCSSLLTDTTSHRIMKYNDSEDVHILTLDLQAQLVEMEKKIMDTQTKYKQISARLQSYEETIAMGRNEISDILKAKEGV